MSHLQCFKVSETIASNYGDLMLPETFPDKVIPRIDFTDEAVVQFDISIVKITL